MSVGIAISNAQPVTPVRSWRARLPGTSGFLRGGWEYALLPSAQMMLSAPKLAVWLVFWVTIEWGLCLPEGWASHYASQNPTTT